MVKQKTFLEHKHRPKTQLHKTVSSRNSSTAAVKPQCAAKQPSGMSTFEKSLVAARSTAQPIRKSMRARCVDSSLSILLRMLGTELSSPAQHWDKRERKSRVRLSCRCSHSLHCFRPECWDSSAGAMEIAQTAEGDCGGGGRSVSDSSWFLTVRHI